MENNIMKNLTKISSVILLAGLVSACGSTNNAGDRYSEAQSDKYEAEVANVAESIDSVPGWFLEDTPYDQNGFYAVSVGRSTDMIFAIKEARLRAQAELAGHVSQLVSSQEKLFGKSVKGIAGSTMQTTIESFIKESDVAGTRFDRKELVQVGTEYVYYVRAYLPVTAMAEAQKRAEFAADLELSSVNAQNELMLRIAKANKEKLAREKVAADKTKAQAELRATQLVEQAQL
jgi:hypothetical protein